MGQIEVPVGSSRVGQKQATIGDDATHSGRPGRHRRPWIALQTLVAGCSGVEIGHLLPLAAGSFRVSRRSSSRSWSSRPWNMVLTNEIL